MGTLQRRTTTRKRRAHRVRATRGSGWLLTAATIVFVAAWSAVGAAAASPATSRREPVAPTIGVEHGHLTLAGAPYRFVGLNAYELATFWGRNAGCGAMLGNRQLSGFFASIPRHSLVRIWAWQGSMAINYRTKQLDWGPLDRAVFRTAAISSRLPSRVPGRTGRHLRRRSLEESGVVSRRLPHAYNDDGRGLAPIPYWDYVRAVVTRYSNAPALGMWEPLNEPETSSCAPGYSGSSCYGHLVCLSERMGARALRAFFDAVGGEIHRLDPRHLVESGFIGSGQCGTSGGDYRYVDASPGIDVLSYHDYYAANARVGGDRWNGIAVRLHQAAALGKPIIGGEIGIAAGSGGGCSSRSQRVANMRAKATLQMSAGSDGVLLWDWEPAPTSRCDYSTYPGDPILRLVGPRR